MGGSGTGIRLPSGLVPAAAIWLFVGDSAAHVSGAIIAKSAREFSRPHDVVPSPNGAFLYVADIDSDSIKALDPSTLIPLGAFNPRDAHSTAMHAGDAFRTCASIQVGSERGGSRGNASS